MRGVYLEAAIRGGIQWLYIIQQLCKGNEMGKSVNISRFLCFVKRLFRKRSKAKITYVYRRYQTPVRRTYRSKQEEIDTILDKIYERGYDRLTKVEKQKLQDASHSI